MERTAETRESISLGVATRRTETNVFYRPELDMMRFFAFLGVFIFHVFPIVPSVYEKAGFPATLSRILAAMAASGGFGVDLFFLLSAFLLTELLLRESHTSGSIHVKSFYVRRMLRIWPLYFFCIALAYIIALFDSSQCVAGEYAFWYVFMLGNWTNILSQAAQTNSVVITPLWTISLEEQFYLLWPNVVKRWPREKSLWLVACLLLITSISTRIWLAFGLQSPISANVIWFNTFTRLDGMAAGVGLCLCLRKSRFNLRSPAARFFVILAGVALWAVVADSCNLNRQIVPNTGQVLEFLAAALGAALVFLGFWGIGWRNSGLVYLGKISYGLYMFHIFVQHYIFKGMGTLVKHSLGFALYVLVAFVATVIISAASYKILEAPFLRLKERYTYVRSRPV